MTGLRIWKAYLALGIFATAVGAAPVTDRAPFVCEGTASSAKIVWHTQDIPTTSRIEYATDPEGPWTAMASSAPVRRHVVTFTGLLPDTVYYYRIYHDPPLVSYGGPDYRFRTAPLDGGSPFRFFAIGDGGSGLPAQAQVASQIRQALPDFGVYTGDVVYDQGEPWNFQPKHFTPYASVLRNAFLYTAPGNHDWDYGYFDDPGDDGNLGGYLDQFHLPRNNPAQTEMYYSFDYGNAHFVSLNSSWWDAQGAATQRAFLAQTLGATTKRWKIVYFHYPPYTSGGGGYGHAPSPWMRLPEFDDHQVDLVLTGHNHWYERSHPIRAQIPNPLPTDDYVNNDPENPIGTIYAVTGGGGRSLYSLPPSGPSEIKVSASRYHFTQIDIDGDLLTLRAIDSAGVQFDRMTITKQVGTSMKGSASRSPVLLRHFDRAIETRPKDPRWDPRADLDGSGEVNLEDVRIHLLRAPASLR